MALLDILVVVAFIGYAIISGLRSREIASRNLDEYFLAGRSLKGWQAGISMAATQFAADTPLLVVGLIATAGVFSLWRLWIYAVAFLMMGFVLASSWRRVGVLTDAELTEVRYSSKAVGILRGVKAIYFGTIFNCTVLAMVLLAATRIAEPFLLWHEWLPPAVFQPVAHFVEWMGVPLTITGLDYPDVWIRSASNVISIGAIVLVTTFYSATGGLRSVVATDIVQFGAAMIATAVFTWCVVSKAGGFQAITQQILTLFPEGRGGGISGRQILAFTPSEAKDASIPVLLVLALQWLVQMNADGTGYLAQRSMACRSDVDAKTAAIVFTVSQVLVRSLLWLPLGLGLLVLFPPDQTLSASNALVAREFTYVRGISELLPVGAKGLMLAGMLAALASTLDTHLNWGASYWTNDIYRRFICRGWLKHEPSGRSLVRVARLANLLILAIAFSILPLLSSIQMAWQGSLLLGAGMGVMLVLRWLWWRINAWGELGCIAASFTLAPFLLLMIPSDQEALRLLLMAMGSTAVGVAVSLLVGPEDRDTLVRFYRKAKPPGFWGPIARDAGETDGEATKRLLRGGLATLAGAFSIFCFLVSLGSWLIESPVPQWVPWPAFWTMGLFVVGVALVPVWWRYGFDKQVLILAPQQE